MSITTLSSQQFYRKISAAKKAAQSGPVIITNRGRPEYVLLTYLEYQKMLGQKLEN